jgi:uncharacterized protein
MIRLRPHHLLCVLGFQGKGYSDDFTANMAGIVDKLRAPDGDGVQIEVTVTADSICAPCPHKAGEGCVKDAQIRALDQRHAQALGLVGGTRLSWGQAQARIVENVAPGSLAALCAGCQWLPYGLCEDGLARLHNEKERA